MNVRAPALLCATDSMAAKSGFGGSFDNRLLLSPVRAEKSGRNPYLVHSRANYLIFGGGGGDMRPYDLVAYTGLMQAQLRRFGAIDRQL